jgi:hypothetical protein
MAWRTCTAEDDHKWFWIRSEVEGALTFHAVSEEVFSFRVAEINLTVQARLLGQVIAEELVSWDFGVLPSGASRDIDGSSLSNWGSSQTGGFRAKGSDFGMSTLWEATKSALVDKGITAGDADELGDPQHSNLLDADGGSLFKVSGPSAEDWWDYAKSLLWKSPPTLLDWIFFRFGDANLLVWKEEGTDDDYDWTWSPHRGEARKAGVPEEEIEKITFVHRDDLPDGNGIINFGSRKDPEEEE